MSDERPRTLRDARSDHRGEERTVLLDAASRVLAEGGLAALTVRRVAKEVGASTTVVYTLFGGKEGLLDALWIEGFDRLWALEQDAPTSPPLRWLGTLAEAYWQNAVDNPHYYAIVFGSALPAFAPSPEARAHANRTFAVLEAAVQACIDDGTFRDEGATRMAQLFWSGIHGVVSLHLNGHLPDRDHAAELRRDLGRRLAASFFADPPSAPETESTR